MKGPLKSIAHTSNSAQSCRNFNNVEWSIVEKIIKNSQDKFEKEKEFNIEGELNLMRILASYSNILEQNDINPNQDTDYYNFFLTVSRYMQSHNIKDWMEGSAIILQNSKLTNYSHSLDYKSNLDDSNQYLLPQNTNPKNQQYTMQNLGDNSFDNKLSNQEPIHNDSQAAMWFINQKQNQENNQMIDNYQTQYSKTANYKSQGNIHNNINDPRIQNYNSMTRVDKKKELSHAKKNLLQTINNHIQSIENKIGDIEESQNNITRLNISDLDLSNISHNNNNNTTLVSYLNLNAQYNTLRYMNQTKNELKEQFGFDNSFLDQALNQTADNQINPSLWQKNTQYISIKEQEYEEDDEDDEKIKNIIPHQDNYKQDHNKYGDYENNISEQIFTEQQTNEGQLDNQFGIEQNNNNNNNFKQKYGQRDHTYTNTSYDNDLYAHIPQQDTSMSQEKLFTQQNINQTQQSQYKLSKSNNIQNIINDSYSNKSMNSQIQNSTQIRTDSSSAGFGGNNNNTQDYPILKQRLIDQNTKSSTNNSSYLNNTNNTSKLNLSHHLEKYNKQNNSNKSNLIKVQSQNRFIQTNQSDYNKPNKDILSNNASQYSLKGCSSTLSFNPQKSSLLSTYEKQYYQFNRRPSNESNLSNTLGRSELNSFTGIQQPTLLQSKQKHNVSFGENSVISLDENELNFKIKSQTFIRWVQYVNGRRQMRWEKEESVRKYIVALDYYQSMVQQKVLILLKGYNMVMKERRKKLQFITKQSQKNIKQKYFQLYLLNYQLAKIQAKQIYKADKFASHCLKKRYLSRIKLYKDNQKAKKESQQTKQVNNRIFIEFVLMLALEKSMLEIPDKKEFWLRVKSFQSDKACNILSKNQKFINISEQGINDKLKPHLDWLKKDATQRLFQSLVNYKKFVQDTQSFRSCRLKFYIFATWKNRLVKKREQNIVLQQHFNVKYTKLLEKIMTNWRDITSKNSLLKQRYKFLRIQSKYNLLERYFTKWWDKYEYYIQNKEEIVKGYQIKGYLTTKRIFSALLNYSKQSKQKKDYYDYAFTHYSLALSKKVFRGYEIYKEKKQNYYQTINDIEEYAQSKSIRKFFKNWQKQTIQEKMIKNSTKQRLYTKVMKAFQIHSERMKIIHEKIDDILQRKNQTYLTKGLKGFISNYIINQHNLQKAFGFYYQRRLFTTFYQLHHYKERKQRKEINLVEFLNNKKMQGLQNCFLSWKQRTQQKQKRRNRNKIALNHFIRMLFHKMISVLQVNVEHKKKLACINEYMIDLRKKRVINQWRNALINKRCQKHYEKKCLSNIISHWKQYIEMKRKQLLIRREAGLLYQSKLMKIALIFINGLKMNQQKNIYKRSTQENINFICQSKLKKQFFIALKNITSIKKMNKEKSTIINQGNIQSIQKKYFSLWLQKLQKHTIKQQALIKMMEINKRLQMKECFNNWTYFIKLAQYDDALSQKSQNLRDYLLVKRFFTIVKKRSIEKQNDNEKMKAANYYYKRCSFYKLINGFYNSIQEKKQKQISLKHYAVKIVANSFFRWKKYSQEKYERQFYKIMSSTKRDNLLDNSINNYVSEDQQDILGNQGNQLGLNNLSLSNSHNENIINSDIQNRNNYNDSNKFKNNSISIESQFNSNNNVNNLFKNTYNNNNNNNNNKQVQFSMTQDNLLTNNLNYTGIQEDLSTFQFNSNQQEQFEDQ